jgi:hypothetical protein
MLNIDKLRVKLAGEDGMILDGLSREKAVVNGLVRDVLQHLPMEFMTETQKLVGISLEGSVG